MSTLIDLRTEVFLNQAFDSNVYLGAVNGYLNDALRIIARKIDYYGSEASYAFSTVTGTVTYSWPADLGKVRYLRNVELATTLQPVRLRQIDESPVSTGTPLVYATDGPALTLYPTPDGIYDLALRYWALPDLMVADSDVPAIPADYHHLLPFYAKSRCFQNEDDPEMAAYWRDQWERGLADMRVDVKFPSGDGPRRVDSMWENLDTGEPRFVIP